MRSTKFKPAAGLSDPWQPAPSHDVLNTVSRMDAALAVHVPVAGKVVSVGGPATVPSVPTLLEQAAIKAIKKGRSVA